MECYEERACSCAEPARTLAPACEARTAPVAAPAVVEATKPALAALLALTLTLGTVLAGLVDARVAYAETDNIEAEITEEQRRVEETAAAYNDAVARVEELDRQIAENEDRIDEIESELPDRQVLAEDAVRELYLMQRGGAGIVEMLLGSESLGDLFMRFEYLARIQESNASALEALEALRAELEQTRDGLAEARAQADEERDAAQTALAEAQAAREQAQAEAQARAEAERAAAEQAAAESAGKDEAETDNPGDADDAGFGADASGEAAEPSDESAGAPPVSDGADWSTDKATFVSQWAGRIDAFLAGSPLAGQGETFASAAWDYGVDPRFSPAISAVESSKGAYCFNSHNAWGWGSASWGSWEEAIYDHVAGLARGYGYTVTVEGAQKYCPPNWQHWYNSVTAYMNAI